MNYEKLIDFDLYLKAKKNLLSEILFSKFNKKELDAVFAECLNRNKNIIEIAEYAASYTYENIRNLSMGFNPESVDYKISENELYKIISNIHNDESEKIIAKYLNSKQIIKPENLIFCKVKGDSMIGFGFNEGSIALADKSIKAKNNHFVIAEVNEEKYIKKLVNLNGKYFLRSSQPEYPDYPIESIKPIVKAVVVMQMYDLD